MNKKLLSILLVLPMISIYAEAESEMLLDDSDMQAQDTLSTAYNDTKIAGNNIKSIIAFHNELSQAENAANDAVERTKELISTNPARQAAIKFQAHARTFSNEVKMMNRNVALSMQEARNKANNAAERCEKNHQTLLELSATFKNALKQVRNPKELSMDIID